MVSNAPISRTRRFRYSKFAAFDINMCPAPVDETTDWCDESPLGIACAAVWMSNARRAQVFFGHRHDRGKPRPCMNRDEVRRFVSYLGDLTAWGYTLVSWNATPFDWDVLAAESGAFVACRRLAMRHVDMMFHVVCARGHRLSFHKAALGMGVADQVNGRNPEELWSSGHFKTVLGHLSHDVRVTLELAHKCQDLGWIKWTSRAGRDAYLQLPEGWLTVREARHLPNPDVSGLEYPTSRRSLMAWMNEEQGAISC